MPRQNHKKPHLRRTFLGYQIYHYGAVSSTNDIAKEIARKNDERRVIVVAETQTRGRGRAKRRWTSPKGGTWISILLRPQIKPKEVLKLAFITSSAATKTIQQLYDLKAEVKWPNDVLVRGKKICGILTETETKENKLLFVVIGVGINANIDIKFLPEELRQTATSLKHELGREVERKTLMKRFVRNFESRYKNLQRGMWAPLLDEWKSLTSFLGKQVKVTSFDEIIIGEAWDVEDDCSLIIRLENGTIKRIINGDLALRKKA